MSDVDSTHSDEPIGLFDEPADYYKAEPEATSATHILRSGDEIHLRLVGNNPLWGHLLWNAGRTVSDYLEDNSARYVLGKNVLELGAGSGLPSLVCAARGAQKVVVTDYPDADLIENLRYNIEHCAVLSRRENIVAKGYLWGNDTNPLTALLSDDGQRTKFETLILADLLFNHSEHHKLIDTVDKALARGETAYALVFFTPYRPWLLEKDLAFFEIAKSAGFQVKQVLEKQMDKLMFEDDPGDETLRRTVFGYELIRG